MSEQTEDNKPQTTEKKKNWFAKHKVLTVIGVIVIILIVGTLAEGDNNKTATTTSTPSSNTTTTKTETKTEVPKIGQAVRDGKFEFVVASIKCGITSVGTNEYMIKKPQGQFCSLTLSVKNIGNEPQTFSESDQKLLNSTNQQYSPDSMATLYNSPNNNDVFLAQINPGNSIQGALVFDIPKDQTPVTAELHDSAFSGGVKVSLQ